MEGEVKVFKAFTLLVHSCHRLNAESRQYGKTLLSSAISTSSYTLIGPRVVPPPTLSVPCLVSPSNPYSHQPCRSSVALEQAASSVTERRSNSGTVAHVRLALPTLPPPVWAGAPRHPTVSTSPPSPPPPPPPPPHPSSGSLSAAQRRPNSQAWPPWQWERKQQPAVPH